MNMRELLAGGKDGQSADLLLLMQLNEKSAVSFMLTREGVGFVDRVVSTDWMASAIATVPINDVILNKTKSAGKYLETLCKISGGSESTDLISRETMAAVATSSTAMAAVATSSTAMAAVAASSTAMAAVAASSTAMAAVAASSTALNVILKSALARSAICAPGLANTVLQQQEARLRGTLSDTQRFSQVAINTMRDLPGGFGGTGAWDNLNPGDLIVIVRTAGAWNSGNGSQTADWSHLQNNYIVGRQNAGHYQSTTQSGRSVCIGGISFTESGDAAICIDAWRAI